MALHFDYALRLRSNSVKTPGLYGYAGVVVHRSASLASMYSSHVELLERGHTVSVEIAINEQTMQEGVELFKPEIIICPFLKHRVPESIWRKYVCIIVHPGIKGDRGASSLDWAIINGETEWGVTALQAAEEMDTGDIWATAKFKMRAGTKSSIYTLEVTEAAVNVVLQALERYQNPKFKPEPLDYNNPDTLGRLNPNMVQTDRRIDWQTDTTSAIIAKMNAADGSPGVLDMINGREYYLYGAIRENSLEAGRFFGDPGAIVATRLGAICRSTIDGAVWITHLKRKALAHETPSIKLPAAQVLTDELTDVPEIPVNLYHSLDNTFREIWYEEKNKVGYLHFDFHNGAMSTAQCHRLRDAFLEVRGRPTHVLVLMGGRTSWSNGIHLNIIEAANNEGVHGSERSRAMYDDPCVAVEAGRFDGVGAQA